MKYDKLTTKNHNVSKQYLCCLEDFNKIEKVVIVLIISLIYVLTVIMIKIPTSYIIDKFSASYKTEELTVEVTDKEIVKSSILRPYMIGKNVVFVPYPSTHYTITVKNDNEDIKVEVSEQEYNDIKVNDIITVEKIEKYRSSEYVDTIYQLKS